MGTALFAPACSDTASADARTDAGSDSSTAADSAAVDAPVDAASEADTPPEEGGEGGEADAGSTALSLLSLNLHCFIPNGSAYSDDLQRYEAIAQNIAALDVHVVTLQEACVSSTRDAAKDLAARLEQLTAKSWYFSWLLAHPAWQGTPNEAEEGVALLADRPLQDVRSLTYVHQQGLTRVALSASVSIAGSDVRVLTMHLDHQNAAIREEQARETGVAALADAYPSAAAIIAGDLNAKEGSPAHLALTAQGFVDASDPLSANRIDHVFVHRGAGLAVAHVSLVFEGKAAVSDHPGLLARFTPEQPPPVSLTRVRASGSVSGDAFVSIRGSVAPLSWDRGFTLRPQSTGSWDFVSSELSGPFEYKLLKDDLIWQTGGNQSGVGGNDHLTAASF
jgi:endonuclease/exonuclease/phosphatase family metal-dependent hydrolase